MNEYTRREEVRWTLIASLILVACMAPAVVLLVTAQGKLIPDLNAQKAAKASADKVTSAHACSVAAEKLVTEIDVFETSAKAAHVDAVAPPPQPTTPKKKKAGRNQSPPPDKEPDVALAWAASTPSLKLARALAPCRAPTEAAIGKRAEADPAWDAIAGAAALTDPGADPAAQLDAARTLLKTLGTAPADKVQLATKDAEAALAKASDAAAAKAATATVREELKGNVLDRGIALGIGVCLSLITLLLSYLGVRFASARRMATLVPLREAARMGQPGAHAAAVLRLAAHSNGSQPGMVIGAAMGGLLSAVAARLDADFFIVGVMAGCLVGLLVQTAVRVLRGPTQWRVHAAELADVEKPAIPIVLVLSGVNPGLEGTFIKFLDGLSPQDAALAVEKLAAQAEERILAAADAGAAARQQPAAP